MTGKIKRANKKEAELARKSDSKKNKFHILTKDELLFWIIYLLAGPIIGILFYFLVKASFWFSVSRFYGLAYFYFLPGFFIYKTGLYYMNRQRGESSYYIIPIAISIFIFLASTLAIPNLFRGKTITLPILFIIDSVIILISLLFYFLRYKKVI